MSSVVIIATHQQAYLHIARGFVTQGDSTLTIFLLLLFRGEENCSPSTTKALRCSVSGYNVGCCCPLGI